MKKPNALIVIWSQQTIAFRLQHVPYHKFCLYLTPFKKRFPEMTWDPCNRQWLMPANHLQLLYEACRAMFQPNNVKIVSANYRLKSDAVQLSLFNDQ